jgi:GTPase SAR1 family protein
METNTAAQAAPTSQTVIPRRAYRVVLFGMPDAGKTSLLGALAQAAQTQETVLGGKLIDKTHGLMELQRRLYEDRPRETLEEVAPYPIALEPFAGKNAPAPPTVEAVLIDCDGRIANELLARKEALVGDLAKRALAQAVLNADTLVLTVDVAADAAQLKQNFGMFTRFLRTLERSRGQRTEVGGLPVYLVLTKCDLLAKPEDTVVGWMEQVEERKREVHQRFQEFLAQQAAREQMPFGRLDLHVWATAVKRPALADAPARPREPYGVAELFRQCLDSARAFRDRRRRSAQRLGWVFGLLGVLVVFMALLALFLAATQGEQEQTRYDSRLLAFEQAHNQGAAERLRDPGETIKELQAFRDSPLFAKAPAPLRKYVEDHLGELNTYDKFTKEFQTAFEKTGLPESPRFARTEAKLDEFRQFIEEHKLPRDYRARWDDTEIARRLRRWQDEIEVMDAEVKVARKTFAELRDLDEKVKDRKLTVEQHDQYLEQLKVKDRNLPYRKDNATKVGHSRVTYGDIANFEPVVVELEQYQKIRAYHGLDKKGGTP